MHDQSGEQCGRWEAEAAGDCGKMYTDGSGAPCREEVPTFGSTCGAAAVSVNWDKCGELTDVGATLMAVPGNQTVPRAETQALIRALELLQGKQGGEVFSHAMYVIKGWSQLKSTPPGLTPKALCGRNGDLWSVVQALLSDAVQVYKVKAHTTLEDVRCGKITFASYAGNAMADAAAKAASRLSVWPEQVRRLAAWHSTIAFSVAMRIAAVELIHEQQCIKQQDWQILRASAGMSVPEAAEKQLEAIAGSGHQLFQEDGIIKCSRCGLARSLSMWNEWFEYCEGHDIWLPGPKGRRQVRASTHGLAKKALCMPITVAWNGHRILQCGGAYKCIICSTCGGLDAFADLCSTNAGGGRHCETVSATAKEAYKEQKRENEAQRVSDMVTRASVQTAANIIAASVGAPPHPSQREQPAWHAKVDPTHVGKACGGFAFCSRCGSVAETYHGQALLFKTCPASGASEWKLPAGSKGRITRIEAGRFPYTASAGRTRWPDGDAAHIVKRVVRLAKPAAHQLQPVAPGQAENDFTDDGSDAEMIWPSDDDVRKALDKALIAIETAVSGQRNIQLQDLSGPPATPLWFKALQVAMQHPDLREQLQLAGDSTRTSLMNAIACVDDSGGRLVASEQELAAEAERACGMATTISATIAWTEQICRMTSTQEVRTFLTKCSPDEARRCLDRAVCLKIVAVRMQHLAPEVLSLIEAAVDGGQVSSESGLDIERDRLTIAELLTTMLDELVANQASGGGVELRWPDDQVAILLLTHQPQELVAQGLQSIKEDLLAWQDVLTNFAATRRSIAALLLAIGTEAAGISSQAVHFGHEEGCPSDRCGRHEDGEARMGGSTASSLLENSVDENTGPSSIPRPIESSKRRRVDRSRFHFP